MPDTRTDLRVRIKTATAEAMALRAEERRLRKRLDRARGRGKLNDDMMATYRDRVYGLQRRRRLDLRMETRMRHLAYGFLRGREYAAMEAKIGAHTVQPSLERRADVYIGSQRLTFSFPSVRELAGLGPTTDMTPARERLEAQWRGWRERAIAHLKSEKTEAA